MSTRGWAAGVVGAIVVAGSASLLPTGATTAATTPGSGAVPQVRSALGGGLGQLLAASSKSRSAAPQAQSFAASNRPHLAPDANTVRDSKGRVLVQLTPQAGVDHASFRRQAEAQGLDVVTTDSTNGSLQGFVDLSSVSKLAALNGTGTLARTLRPITKAGKASDQGVNLQRVDKVQAKGIDGKGITVGVLSDSYDVATTAPDGSPLKDHAAQDVKSGDLPGKGNAQYPTPVVVLQDGLQPDFDTDEGRGMLQIVHDLAPAAKLCFATADGGDLNFANNIRALADKKGKCGADVVVDDVMYFDEPTFSDNVIADAINDITAKGAHYFSAAGNDGEDASWNSPVKLVPEKQGVKGTGLDFSQVDPSLYDGGLQDMDPGSGSDVAQTVHLTDDPNGTTFDLQWNDPVDLNGATYGDPVFTGTGNITTAKPTQSFTYNAPASMVGKQARFRTDAIPSGTTDLILDVTTPDGTELGPIDTGTSPESLVATIKQAGKYTISVSAFGGDTGDFTVDVRPVTAPSKVTTDFNLLFFDTDGTFLGASADINTLSGLPMEVPTFVGPGDVQVVISRSGTGPVGATQLRDVLAGEGTFQEYSDPTSPSIIGHTMAAGSTAVAAYDPFKPFLPEAYTSPGGNQQVYFDSAGNRYSKPQTRQVPQVASIDRANTTFFVADDPRDADSLPNFGGTSAAAPHAAAIAALVLQKAGGGTKITPSALRSLLEANTFNHDLDPMTSSGTVQGLTVAANGNQGREFTEDPGSMDDPNFFRVSYTGAVTIKNITLYGETASPTSNAGIVFDNRKFKGDAAALFDQGFPFTVGSVSGGLATSSVTPTFSVPPGGDAVNNQFSHLRINFASGLKNGQGVQFGIDRDLAQSGYGQAVEGNGADELGGAVSIPDGTTLTPGMKFVAVLSNGKTIVGHMTNKLGHGFSPIDGFGLINAEKAVNAAP